jgi:hypothetical protein
MNSYLNTEKAAKYRCNKAFQATMNAALMLALIDTLE